MAALGHSGPDLAARAGRELLLLPLLLLLVLLLLALRALLLLLPEPVSPARKPSISSCHEPVEALLLLLLLPVLAPLLLEELLLLLVLLALLPRVPRTTCAFLVGSVVKPEKSTALLVGERDSWAAAESTQSSRPRRFQGSLAGGTAGAAPPPPAPREAGPGERFRPLIEQQTRGQNEKKTMMFFFLRRVARSHYSIRPP